MDATCKVQDNIHVFRLVHNMCPGFWVHIKGSQKAVFCCKTYEPLDVCAAINLENLPFIWYRL